MIIRKFKEADADKLARLQRSTIRNINSKDYSEKQIKAWSGRIFAKKFKDASKTNKILVAIEDETLLGFIDYKEDEIMGLYIHQDYMGKGIGKRLLNKAERDIYTTGTREIKCVSTITARKFYEKNGYKIIKKTTLNLNDQNITVYEMTKTLNPKPQPTNI